MGCCFGNFIPFAAERVVFFCGDRAPAFEHGKHRGLFRDILVEHLDSLAGGGSRFFKQRLLLLRVRLAEYLVLQGQIGQFDRAAPLQEFQNLFTILFERAYADALHLQYRHKTIPPF